MELDLLETLKKWITLTLSKSIYNIFKFSKDNDVSMPQVGALIRIHRQGSCNVSDLGEDLGTSSAAASQLLHRMVQLGLIERSEDPNDRRIKQLNLSQKGLEFLNQCFQASYKWIEDIVLKLNNDEKRDIATVLNTLTDRIEMLNGTSEFEKDFGQFKKK